jgi:hypothetical protein
MPNPYLQVALTYVRRPFSSVLQSFLTLVILFMLNSSFFIIGMAGGYDGNHHEFLPFHLLLFIVLFAYWGIHSKEQFADARASLIPGFRTVHGTVASLTAIFFGIVLPATIAPMIGWQSIGFVSLTVLLFGAILWFVLLQNNVLGWLILFGFAATFTTPVRGGLEQIVLGHSPVHAFTLFGTGAILSIAGIVRLFRINEEMQEYHLKLDVHNRGGQFQMSGLQWQRFFKRHYIGGRGRLFEKFMARLIYHARHGSDSNWSGVHRWVVSYFSVWSTCSCFIGFYFVLLFMSWFLGEGENMIYAFPVIFSSFGTFQQLRSKKPFLSRDLVMPVKRDAYLKQLGMAAAESYLVDWGTCMAVLILLTFTAAVKLPSELLAYTIAFSALAQIWFFGLEVWLLSFRSIVLTSVTLIFAVVLTTAPLVVLIAPFSPTKWRLLALLMGGLLACFGLLLTWQAYRRWLVTDFD